MSSLKEKLKIMCRAFGSLVDICGFSFLYDQTVEDILNKTDKEALKEDWEAVKKDFEQVFRGMRK